MMRYVVLLLSLVVASPAVADKPLQMDDFAYGIPLQVDGDGAIYSLPLPAAVYRHAVRTDLGDLRVFNGHGEVVPHFLQREPREKTDKSQRQEAKFYPLPTRENRPDDEELHISIDRDGTLIDLYGGRLPLKGAGAGEYYLVDAREAAAEVERLYLQWDEVGEPLLAQVSVDGSDDLTHWKSLVEKRTIASLSHDGFQLEQHSLALQRQRMKYYRIHWPPGSSGVALNKIELQYRPQQSSLGGRKMTVSPHSEATREGVYDFALDGQFPVSSVRLLMPQRNTAVRAKLYSRSSENVEWQLRYQGLFYELQREGHRLSSEPVELGALSHPLWRLEVLSNGGGLGSGVPRLELEWYPQRLLFVARGEMPFTLAFGRQQTMSEVMAIDPLLRRIKDDDTQAGMIKTARPGERFELGGEARLQPLAPPLPWKKWLLWAVLILGVLVLALMVRALYRQMSQDDARL